MMRGHPAQPFSTESKACLPFGPSTLLEGPFTCFYFPHPSPLRLQLPVWRQISFSLSLCLCLHLSYALLSCVHQPFFCLSSPQYPCSLPLITANCHGREALSGILSVCSDQRGFLCASPCDSSSERSILQQQPPHSAGTTCLILQKQEYWGGGRAPGVGRDADGTKAKLKAAPQREEAVPGQWA